MTTVLLLRHGETTWNREGRMQGWAPTPLTERGREQARRAGAAIAREYDVDRIVASDLRRTRETTAELLGSVDAEPTFDRRWRERSFGDLQGLTVEAVFEGHPEYSLLNSDIAAAARATPPGGESLVDARERVLDGWDALDPDDGTVLVVTHGGPIFLLLAHVRGQDFETAMAGGWPENAGLVELRVGADPIEVVRDGDALHDPVEQHEDTHPAGRDGEDGAVAVAEDEPSSTGEAVAERVESERG